MTIFSRPRNINGNAINVIVHFQNIHHLKNTKLRHILIKISFFITIISLPNLGIMHLRYYSHKTWL